MINLALAQWLISLILLVIAYFISITINGVMQTLVLSYFGDSTAEDEGYLSCNPLTYFDLFNFIWLVFVRVGWPYSVPLNISNIQSPYRLLKLFIIEIVSPIVSLLIAIISLTLLVIFFGSALTIHLATYMFSAFADKLPSKIFLLQEAVRLISEHSSYSSSFFIILALLLIALVFLNLYLAVFSLVINSIRYFLLLGFEHSYKYIKHADFLTVFGPLIVYIFLGGFIYNSLLNLTITSACKIAFLFS